MTGERPSSRVIVAASALAVLLVGAGVVLTSMLSDDDPTDFSPTMTLLTNEHAHRNGDGVEDPRWTVTSGSLFASPEGELWSGVPDHDAPGPRSRRSTGSAVLRALAEPPLQGPAVLRLSFRVVRFTTTETTPQRGWDGLHLFARYQDERSLYVVSVARRDGHIAIKKKVPGGASNGGTYHTLADRKGFMIADGSWHDAELHVGDGADGSVVMTLSVDGEQVLEGIDDGTGGAVISGGRYGLRGDNAELRVLGFSVDPAS